MDRQFLEFWGNFMLNAAKSQKQLEDLTAWMKGGLKGFEELSSLFQKVYGVEKVEKESPDGLKTWAKAQESFTQGYREYLALLGVVPHQEHLELVRKYEELKAKVASQEETISHLRMLLSQNNQEGYQNMAGQFEELAKKQGEQFQKLMESFSQSVKKTGASEA
jgi:predicted nuclease with TOPRIM domain